jgi:hypothetical protein
MAGRLHLWSFQLIEDGVDRDSRRRPTQVHHCSPGNRSALWAGIGLGLFTAFTLGCSSGIRWHGYTFDSVHAESRQDQKLTLVYFRHWSVIACTEFEDNVLKDPRVLEVSADLYCVPLDFNWDRPLAEEWGITELPGVVILDPEERILARLSGDISVEKLLDAIAEAQSQFAPASKSSGVP